MDHQALHDLNEKTFRRTLEKAPSSVNPDIVIGACHDFFELIRRRIDRGVYDEKDEDEEDTVLDESVVHDKKKEVA